jgi:hypothetical protein
MHAQLILLVCVPAGTTPARALSHPRTMHARVEREGEKTRTRSYWSSLITGAHVGTTPARAASTTSRAAWRCRSSSTASASTGSGGLLDDWQSGGRCTALVAVWWQSGPLSGVTGAPPSSSCSLTRACPPPAVLPRHTQPWQHRDRRAGCCRERRGKAQRGAQSNADGVGGCS